MTIRKKGDNSALTKTSFTSLLGAATKTVQTFTVPEDIIENYDSTGSNPKNFETQTRLKFTAGQQITQTDIDNAFPPATVTSVTPSSGLPAAGGTTVTIKGTNFAGVSGVTFGGTAATSVKVKDQNTLTCVTPAKTAGSVAVVVKDDNADVAAGNVTFV